MANFTDLSSALSCLSHSRAFSAWLALPSWNSPLDLCGTILSSSSSCLSAALSPAKLSFHLHPQLWASLQSLSLAALQEAPPLSPTWVAISESSNLKSTRSAQGLTSLPSGQLPVSIVTPLPNQCVQRFNPPTPSPKRAFQQPILVSISPKAVVSLSIQGDYCFPSSPIQGIDAPAKISMMAQYAPVCHGHSAGHIESKFFCSASPVAENPDPT